MKTKSDFFMIFLGVILLCGLLFFSCKPRVKGADGQVYHSYQAACAAKDFTAAHKYLVKLKDKVDDGFVEESDYYDAVDYVFKQECLYLLSMDDEEFATKRIVFLLKEAQADDTDSENNDSRCDWLLDLAIDMDKEDFLKSLTKLYNEKISESALNKIIDYFYVQKGEVKSDFLISLLDRNDQLGLLINAALVNGNEKYAIELAKQYDKCIELDDKNIISKLASKKDRSLSDAIIKALSAITIGGSPFSAGLHYYYDSDRDISKDTDKTSHFRYADDIANYNKQCESILNIAIASGNQYLAQKVLVQFREKPVFIKGDRYGRNNIKAPDGTIIPPELSYLYYSDEDKKSAQKKYQEAVRNGSFK